MPENTRPNEPGSDDLLLLGLLLLLAKAKITVEGNQDGRELA
jgi:hypothetical protein